LEKSAGAFTNSGSMSGDKGVTVGSPFSFAMRHGTIWIGAGLLPSASKEAARNDPNFLKGYTAALTQSPMRCRGCAAIQAVILQMSLRIVATEGNLE
jgi:hypothetical protein